MKATPFEKDIIGTVSSNRAVFDKETKTKAYVQWVSV